MQDLTKITSAFGLLDDETQAALRAHPGAIELFTELGWIESIPHWIKTSTYRASPTLLTKPWVPPGVLADQWRWLARNKGGYIYAYTDAPLASSDAWIHSKGFFLSITVALHPDQFVPGTCNWRDSLAEIEK